MYTSILVLVCMRKHGAESISCTSYILFSADVNLRFAYVPRYVVLNTKIIPLIGEQEQSTIVLASPNIHVNVTKFWVAENTYKRLDCGSFYTVILYSQFLVFIDRAAEPPPSSHGHNTVRCLNCTNFFCKSQCTVMW